ncbi:MAG: CHAD domain-containing protein [Polyangiales bacterium]
MGATPSATDTLAAQLLRRVAFGLAIQGEAPPRVRGALRSLAGLAARAGAGRVDALVLDDEVVIALADPPPAALPARGRELASAERALGKRARFVDASWLSQAPVPEGAPARDALASVSRWHLAHVAALAEESSRSDDPEVLHQLRVSLRRLRTALRLLDRRDPFVAEVVAFARALGAAAGPVRDLDVAAEALPTLVGASSSREALLASIASRRAVAVAAFEAHVSADEFHATLRSLLAPWPRPRRPKGSLRAAGRRAVDDGLDALAGALDGDLTHAEGYHEVRRRARRVRDLVEVLDHALKKPERRWRSRLQPLQSALGSLHDVDVMLGLAAGVEGVDGPLRDALTRQRTALLAEVATPLAMLASRLREA